MKCSADGKSVWIVLKKHLYQINTVTASVELSRPFDTIDDLISLGLSPDGRRLLINDGWWRLTLIDLDAGDTQLGHYFGGEYQWYPDSRYFLTGGLPEQSNKMGVGVYDCQQKLKLGTLHPLLSDGHWLSIGPTGHYQGSPGVESQFVYVVQLDDGSNLTLSPNEFATRFAWKNDPDQATLLRE